MPTIEDLGRDVKAKYPGKYDDMSDAEVGRSVKAEYAPAYDDYEETGVSVLERSPIFTPRVSLDLSHQQQKFENLTKDLIRYYNPRQGRLSAWWNRRKAESRVNLLRVLNEEQRLVLEQAAIAEEAAMSSERGRKEFEKFIANHVVELMELRLSASIIDHALNMGVDKETAIYLNKVRVLDEHELNKLERQSYIRTREYRDQKEIDHEFLVKEHDQHQKNITRIQQEPLELEDRARERLFGLYDEREQLIASNDPAKEHKLKMLNHNISMAEQSLYGGQNRPVQDAPEQDVEGDYSTADSRGRNTASSGTGDESKRKPGRPRKRVGFINE